MTENGKRLVLFLILSKNRLENRVESIQLEQPHHGLAVVHHVRLHQHLRGLAPLPQQTRDVAVQVAFEKAKGLQPGSHVISHRHFRLED